MNATNTAATAATAAADTVTWSNRVGSRGRKAWLLIFGSGTVRLFEGAPMPGVAVLEAAFTKDGKWSHTTYRLVLAPGITALAGRDGWDTGRFTEGLADALRRDPINSWTALAAALGVPVTAAMDFLAVFRPQEAAALDDVDAQLDALEEAEAEAETLTLSFGAPTRRQREEGFWTAAKDLPGGGAVALRNATAAADASAWTKENVILLDSPGGVVIDVVARRGHGGGYVTVTIKR